MRSLKLCKGGEQGGGDRFQCLPILPPPLQDPLLPLPLPLPLAAEVSLLRGGEGQ